LVVTRPEFFPFLRDALHAHDSLYAHAALWPGASALRGRGVAYRIDTPHGDWVIRRGRRGGTMGGLLVDRYLRLGEPRQLRELAVSERARAAGVRTPEVKAVVLAATRWFVRGDVATEYIGESEDLAALGFGAGERSVEAQHAAWRAAGHLIRELAAARLFHPDLNLKNILIRFTPGGPEAWVLDLDRARMGRSDAAAMWARLQRSLAKWERITARPLAPALKQALESGFRD
jgi:hypothetical protein